MQVEPRIDLAKATLAVFALAAVANRFWLHWCSITLADVATGVLVAATVAVAGQRPGVNARPLRDAGRSGAYSAWLACSSCAMPITSAPM